jgi:hypothetical protein
MSTFIMGTGVMPSAGAIGQQLTDITRPGFLPALIDQTSKSTPLLAMLMANNQSFGGGASSINVPAQFGDMVQTQASDYSGVFSLPSDIPAIQNATFNGKLSITPIPMFGVEAIIQDNYAIVNLMEARMNSAGNNFASFWNTALYSNSSDPTRMIGLPAAIDDGTNAVTYGGISRNAQTAWKSYVRAVAANTNLTRIECMKHIMNVVKQCGGEKPNCAFVGVGTWMSLAADFVGQETYQITPGASFDSAANGPRAGFEAIRVAGIPVFCDINCADGEMWILNSNYINLYVHERLSFALMPFESMQASGQLGYIGAVVNLAELVNAKPSTCGHVTGLNVMN